MKFDELNISSKLNRKIMDLGFCELTPIQDKCIPEIVNGKDMVGQSKTGSGKTFAFAIPIIDKVQNGKGIQAGPEVQRVAGDPSQGYRNRESRNRLPNRRRKICLAAG